jgi:hypothetical protein
MLHFCSVASDASTYAAVIAAVASRKDFYEVRFCVI